MEEEGLDLKAYWAILLRRWWILVLGVIGAAVLAFFVTEAKTPIYQASAKVFVQGGQSPGIPSSGDIQASQQLAQNYTDLVKTQRVLGQVVEELSLPYGSGALSGKISLSSPRQLIVIKVSDPDPVLAATIANTVAQVFIDDTRDRQLTQIAQFQASLSQYGITQDLSLITAQAATLSTLSIADGAIPPTSPSSPNMRLNVLLAAMLGLLAAGLVVLVLEHLDDSVKSQEELKALTGLTTLGAVMRYRTSDSVAPSILGDEHQRTPLAESYKILRSNLEFAAVATTGLKALLVTSSSPQEGKSTTAANLAISVAREGKSVILVDSDLRKPSLHRVFDLGDHKGFTNVVLGNATLQEAMAATEVEGLRVVPSGPLPPDATLILRSPKIKELVGELKNSADMVIFDTPPLLAVADPMLLAPMADGVLLVVDIHHTGREAVRQGVETIRQANPALIAAVLNKVSAKGRGYYYYYYYYYGDDRDKRSRADKIPGALAKVFRRGKRRRSDRASHSSVP